MFVPLLKYHYIPPLKREFIRSSLRWKHASPVTTPLTTPSSNFLISHSASYIEEMHTAWEKDPNTVHLSWRLYFNNLHNGLLPDYQPPPNLGGIVSTSFHSLSKLIIQQTLEQINNSYLELGHYHAQLDPLKLMSPKHQVIWEEKFQFLKSQQDVMVTLGPNLLPGYFKAGITSMSVHDTLNTLNQIYCSNIGFDFRHLNNPLQFQWLREKIEAPRLVPLSINERELALKRLIDADSFERIFGSKFATVKRYGVEGGDAMLPALAIMLDYCGDLGVNSVSIGMPHRGRLNVYTNLMGQPAEAIFSEFSGKGNAPHPLSGDSAYHLTVNNTHISPNGNSVALSLTANPSHLEAVNPVTLGITYAKQQLSDPQSTMSILLHGDAAISGQGIVYETMGFHNLPQYTTHGTIHMVVNNQIGFTTNPNYSRSSDYCCDVAKLVQAPVFHVNGDDIDAVLEVSKLACEWRQEFKTDVFIDLVCYRRHGHNEVDQPSYTQPKMYQKISKHPSVAQVYIDKIKDTGVMSESKIKSYQTKSWEKMQQAYQTSQSYQAKAEKWSKPYPELGLLSLKEVFTQPIPSISTASQNEHLKQVANVIGDIPTEFQCHENLMKVLKVRKKMATDLTSIDWATAEQLAFGTLLLEGVPIRLSGQDVERGTFSQRHCVLIDQNTESRYIPLHQLSPSLQVCNSHLSEFAVLGFEYGYSVQNPQSLVMWEAQFGDFSNVAQCMIDQFVASGEQKWLQSSGLTMLLPHGFDGNGPEHSSGRMERYLQLVDESPVMFPPPNQQPGLINWSIVSCSTPSNYFHVLRRQVHRPFRKPLIAFNGKAILRHPLARSNYQDLQGEFQRGYPEMYPEELEEPKSIRTHILCTGQIYYHLLQARRVNQLRDVAISRIEELAPFPADLISEYIAQYPQANLVWCQEEPINLGAYSYLTPRIQTILPTSHPPLQFVGRPPSAAVATGHKSRHLSEYYDLISTALYGSPRPIQGITNGTPQFSS